MYKSGENLLCAQAIDYFACLILALTLTIGLSLSGCATTKTPEEQASAINKADPYENFNRKVYGFNDTVDHYVAKPIADGYKYITPDFMETGVSNFFNNLKSINVVLNDILQAKFEQSGRDTGRFLMNSTLGMAGLFDVAKTVGLESNDEDFEQTLAVWGVPQGTYIVLPFLGPITTRGMPGAIFDTATNPTTYLGPIVPIQAISLINTRANAEGALKFIDEAALDPYVFTRESFLQWRNHLATDGKDDSSSDVTDIDADLLDDSQNAPNKQTEALKGGVTEGKAPSPSTAIPNKKESANSAISTKRKDNLRILPPDAGNVMKDQATEKKSQGK